MVKLTYRPGIYDHWGQDGYRYWRTTKRLSVTALQRYQGRQWRTWMVDDPPQWAAMRAFAAKSTGRVAVAGLGLGLVTQALLTNPKVTDVTLIEIDPNVKRLVWPMVLAESPAASRVHQVLADAVEYLTDPKCERFDRIILDLWVTSGKAEWDRELWGSAIPITRAVRFAHPESSIVVHGFGGIPERTADTVYATLVAGRLRVA